MCNWTQCSSFTKPQDPSTYELCDQLKFSKKLDNVKKKDLIYKKSNFMVQDALYEVCSYSEVQEISHFSLPCSQDSVTGSCPEPDESSPHILFL